MSKRIHRNIDSIINYIDDQLLFHIDARRLCDIEEAIKTVKHELQVYRETIRGDGPDRKLEKSLYDKNPFLPLYPIVDPDELKTTPPKSYKKWGQPALLSRKELFPDEDSD